MEDKVTKEEIETFLRNVPNPVILGIFGDNCSPCGEMDDAISNRQLPEGVAFAKITLSSDPEDLEIAELLGTESVPTIIGFCRGEELGRTSDPGQVDEIINNLRGCNGSAS